MTVNEHFPVICNTSSHFPSQLWTKYGAESAVGWLGIRWLARDGEGSSVGVTEPSGAERPSRKKHARETQAH